MSSINNFTCYLPPFTTHPHHSPLTAHTSLLTPCIFFVTLHSSLLILHSSPLTLHPSPGLLSTGLIENDHVSLFTYPDGMDSEDYYNSSWQPQFLSNILQSADQETLDRCTPAGGTEPLAQCVFDATETGDINIGMATVDTNNENILANMESS